jgi:hypothetical protein
MPDSEPKSDNLPQRLCSEIQLFDLCDLDACKRKSGRFCTDPDLVNRFEKIAEAELRTPERYISDEDDSDFEDEDAYHDEFTTEDSEDADEGWDEEV